MDGMSDDKQRKTSKENRGQYKKIRIKARIFKTLKLKKSNLLCLAVRICRKLKLMFVASRKLIIIFYYRKRLF